MMALPTMEMRNTCQTFKSGAWLKSNSSMMMEMETAPQP